jgi:hypothetical protein
MIVIKNKLSVMTEFGLRLTSLPEIFSLLYATDGLSV